jgi:hypothetical protein
MRKDLGKKLLVKKHKNVAVFPPFQFREAHGSVSLLVSVAVVPFLLSTTLASRRLNSLQNKTRKM